MKKPARLGYETIYPLQQRVAERTMQILRSNETCPLREQVSPLNILQPQGGKTGVMSWNISLFIDDCIARRRTFQIIALCGLPHLDLTNQTRDRLTESVLNDGVTPFGAQLDIKARSSGLLRLPGQYQSQGIVILHNNSTLRRLDLNQNVKVDTRLWVGDEIHLGNVKDGNLTTLFKNHGVLVNQPLHTWDHSRGLNHFVGVSATPSAHMLHSDNIDLDGDPLFRWIYEAPPSNYNSLSRMRSKGRLKQTEALFDKLGKPTPFMTTIYAEFLANCITQGCGYLVIRATGKKHSHLMGYLNRRGARTPHREFDSHSRNIDELNVYLSTQPSEPTVVVIRGSMRAGITLNASHHLRGWVETESGHSDAQAQSGAGRACGYNRTHESYPIYCGLAQVDRWIQTYEALDIKSRVVPIPTGLQNRGLETRKVYPAKEVLGYKQAWDKYVKPYRDNDKDKAGKKGSDRYRAQLSTTQQVYLDVAGMFLEGRRDSGSTRGIHVNGSTPDEKVEAFIKAHPEHDVEKVWGWARRNRESYRKLLQYLFSKFPDFEEGMVVALEIDEAESEVRPGQSRNGLQKKNSALRA